MSQCVRVSVSMKCRDKNTIVYFNLIHRASTNTVIFPPSLLTLWSTITLTISMTIHSSLVPHVPNQYHHTVYDFPHHYTLYSHDRHDHHHQPHHHHHLQATCTIILLPLPHHQTASASHLFPPMSTSPLTWAMTGISLLGPVRPTHVLRVQCSRWVSETNARN